MKHALISLFLVMLVACSAQEPLVQIQKVEVPVRVYAPVPEELTTPCRVPEFPEGVVTYGDVIDHDLETMGAVESCNGKLRAIKELQDSIVE